MKHHRIGLLWQRFGPYHTARLRGLQTAALDIGWETMGIEVASRDEYAWAGVDGGTAVRTLFPQQEYCNVSIRALSQKLCDALEQEGITAVCVNGWSVPEAIVARKWALKRGLPVILMSETYRASGNWIKEWVKRLRVRRCHGALVGGAWHRDYLIKLGMDPHRIRLGYDVVDNYHFATPRSLPEESFGRKIRSPYFFVNTRFLPRKGVSYLLKAYAELVCDASSNAPDCWDLVISGSGDEGKAWKGLADRLRISHRVHWIGFVQYAELPAWYQHAGAFVHPATAEAWGLVINEACAAGLPIIAGRNVGATCELVENGSNGWLIDSTNVASLKDVLRQASTLNADHRRQMGNASRRKVAALSPEFFGQSVCELVQLPPRGKHS